MPDVYDAGAVRARAELDRDPFIDGLRFCLERGKEFARQKFEATATINTARARAELDKLEEQMRRIADIDIDVNVRGGAAARIELQRLKTEQAMYRAEMEQSRIAQQRYRAEQERMKVLQGQNRLELERTRQAMRAQREEQDRLRASTKRTTDQAKKDFPLMRTAIEQLGPPLVPLAGGLVATGTALIGLGTAGILAFKGIGVEMKAGTPLGVQYAGTIQTVKGSLAELEHTAAGGVLTGFQAAMAKVNSELPAFNSEVGQSSAVLGDVASHLVGGLIGGFNTFNPLILKTEGYVDSLAARFEKWAGGDGGAHFASTLSTDFDHMVPALENIVTLASHLVSAFQPVGLGMLDNVSRLSDVLDHIPVGVLQAGATAYIAFRTAVTVTTGFNAAIKALEGFTGASTAAAAAAGASGASGAAGAAARGGFLGRGAGMLLTTTRTLLPFAAAWAGAAIAINSAASATESWRTSTDRAKSLISNTAYAVGGILTGNFGALGKAQQNAQAGANASASVAEAQDWIHNVGAGPRAGGSLPNIAETRGAQMAADAYTRQRVTLSNLRQTWMAANADMSRLARTQGVGSAAMAEATSRAREASTAYYALKQRMDLYIANTRTAAASNRDLAAQQERTAASYASGVDNRLGGLRANSLVQSPTVTSGVTGLQAYAKAVTATQKAEESWTKVTDDHTIKIRGQKYELTAWDAAVAQANGDGSVAVGILEGHTRALDIANRAQAEATAMQTRLSTAIGEAETKYQLSDAQLNTYAAAVGITTANLANGEISQRQWLAAIGEVKGVVDTANTSTDAWVTALTQFEGAADTAASRGQLLAAAMVSINGAAIGYGLAGSNVAKANQDFVNAFRAADKGVVNLKTGFIDFHNAGAQPLYSALSQLQAQASQFAAVTYQNEVATRGRTQAAKDAAAVYYNDTAGALIKEHKQLGLTRDEAEKLAQRYFHWPAKATTQIQALGTERTNQLLNGIGEQLSFLTHHKWQFNVDADTSAADAKISSLLSRLNSLPGGSNAAAGINKTVGIIASRSAAGDIFDAYAAGGMREDHTPRIHPAQPNRVRVFAEPETQGEAYIPLAHDWRRPRAKALVSEVARRLGGVSYFETGGFTGVTTPKPTAPSSSGGSSGSSTSAAASKGNAAYNRLQTLFRQIQANKIEASALWQLDKMTTSSLTSYAAALLREARKAYDLHAAPSWLVKRVQTENTQLAAALRTRDTLAGKRKAADAKVAGDKANIAQERATVAGNIMGGFDAGTSGNGYRYGIQATLDQQVSDATKFEALRKKAKALGLNAGMLKQITEEGPAQAGANLEAIVGGGKGYVSSLNKSYAKLGATAGRIGQAQGMDLYGKQLAEDTAKQVAIARDQRKALLELERILRLLRADMGHIRTDIRDKQRQITGRR